MVITVNYYCNKNYHCGLSCQPEHNRYRTEVSRIIYLSTDLQNFAVLLGSSAKKFANILPANSWSCSLHWQALAVGLELYPVGYAFLE